MTTSPPSTSISSARMPRKVVALLVISALMLIASVITLAVALSSERGDEAEGASLERAAARSLEPALLQEEPEALGELEAVSSDPDLIEAPARGAAEAIAMSAETLADASLLHKQEGLAPEAIELGFTIEELAQQGQGARPSKRAPKRKTLKPATLIVKANFDITDVTINGLPYPEYYEDDEEEGMVIPAGGPYTVNVIYSGKTKTHTFGFAPYETRYLIAEIPGYAGTSAPPPSAPPAARPESPQAPEPEEEEQSEEEEQAGRVTVYAKPRGDIMLDGKEVGQKTPNTIESPDGRHEVQVRYEDGEMSEKKVVRVRKGSRIKLFFRQRKDK